jgi:hypothetical protein
MSTDADLVNRVRLFLQKMEAGDFLDEEERAFQELEYALDSSNEVQLFMQNEYIPSLYGGGKAQRRQLSYLIHATSRYTTRQLACSLVQALIRLYCRSDDAEILSAVFQVVSEYRLFDFVSLENEGRSVRFFSDGDTFTVASESIRQPNHNRIAKLIKEKYALILVQDELPNAQEIQSVVQRLNSAIDLLVQNNQNSLQHDYALLPLATGDIRYSPKKSTLLFGSDLGELAYEEQLYRHYQLPLFPLISEDKLSFENGALKFGNEGLGCLPSTNIRIVVGENEFEMGETQGVLPFDEEKKLYLNDLGELVSFLKNQSPNIDVKVVFSFRKYGRYYEYAVLSSPVGHWLEEIPSKIADSALPYEIPLADLDSHNFERLCMWIVEEAKTDELTARFTKVTWLNEDGGGEQGRDVIATELKTNRKYVFQCKRVEKFGVSEIRTELKRFQVHIQSSPEIKPDVYVLFLSSAITAETKRVGDDLAREIDMEIEYWPKSKIDYLVRNNPVVRERFWKQLP